MSVGVRTRIEDQILIITIGRPSANAIDAATSAALYAAFAKFEAIDEPRVGIVTGSGERFFSAG